MIHYQDYLSLTMVVSQGQQLTRISEDSGPSVKCILKALARWAGCLPLTQKDLPTLLLWGGLWRLPESSGGSLSSLPLTFPEINIS